MDGGIVRDELKSSEFEGFMGGTCDYIRKQVEEELSFLLEEDNLVIDAGLIKRIKDATVKLLGDVPKPKIKVGPGKTDTEIIVTVEFTKFFEEEEVDWEINGIVNKQHEEIQDGKKITVIDDFELTGISIISKKE